MKRRSLLVSLTCLSLCAGMLIGAAPLTAKAASVSSEAVSLEGSSTEIAYDFLWMYVADQYGKPYVAVDDDNRAQILAGQNTYNGLSKGERMAVDNLLNNLTGATYSEWLAMADPNAVNAVAAAKPADAPKAPEAKPAEEKKIVSIPGEALEVANTFIGMFVADSYGKIYVTVTDSNRAQILSGKDTYDNLSGGERLTLNNLLDNLSGKTYPEWVALCQQ